MLSFEAFLIGQLGPCHNPEGWVAVINSSNVNKAFWETKYQNYKDMVIPSFPVKEAKIRIINKKAVV